MGIAAIGAAAAPVIGGIVGNLAAQGDYDAQMDAYKKAQDIIAGVRVPTAAELSIVFDELSQQGQLTPELQTAMTQKATEMGGIKTPQELVDVQRSALKSLMQSGKTGLNPEDRAALQQIQSQVNQQQRGTEGAIMQNMQARGMGGSGSELAQRLMASQGSADRAQSAGLNIGAQANQRALQAIQAAGQLGGQQQAQNFGEQSAVAQAQDAINRFNIANQQQVQTGNVGALNAAQLANLGEKQRVSDTNVGLRNQSKLQNVQNLKDIYNMEMGKARAAAGLSQDTGNLSAQEGQRTSAMWNQIGSGVGKGFAAGGGGAGAAASNRGSYQPSQGTPDYLAEGGEVQPPGGHAKPMTNEEFYESEAKQLEDTGDMRGAAAMRGNLVDRKAAGGEINPAHQNPMPENDDHTILKQLIEERRKKNIKSMKRGGQVPGQAKVPGDSYTNDTVDARLSPGEIVLPRSVTTGKNAPEKAAEFVAKVLHHMGKLHGQTNKS